MEPAQKERRERSKKYIYTFIRGDSHQERKPEGGTAEKGRKAGERNADKPGTQEGLTKKRRGVEEREEEAGRRRRRAREGGQSSAVLTMALLSPCKKFIFVMFFSSLFSNRKERFNNFNCFYALRYATADKS